MIWNGAKGKKAKNAIKLICSRFSWHSEKVFRIVNESNLDCYIEIYSTDPDDDDIDKRNIKLISAVKVDNLFENKQLNSSHMLKEK